jgi:preprotein translocase subunit SecG
MGFVIGLLTVVMVFDCLLLILLILIQLPKKEAGAALAFGGGTTDALFGAGSGTVLTKITKYAAISFFVLLILIALLQKSNRGSGADNFRSIMEQESRQPGNAPAPTPAAQPSAGVNLLTSTNVSAPAVDSTNAAPK